MKCLFLVLFLFSLFCVRAKAEEIPALTPFNPDDRVLILSPHPDDESIACAGVIQEALKAGAKVRVVYLTNGEHNEFAFIVYEKRIPLIKGEFVHLGQVRQQEAIKAAGLLGLKKKQLVFLGYPDFGTFAIFSDYWQTKRAFSSFLTHISSVPYKDLTTYGAPYIGENILNDIERVLLYYRPTKIFVSHPADSNVDHKAFYLFLRVALADLKKEIPVPAVYPYLVHSAGWPLPRNYHPEFNLEPPSQFLNKEIDWRKLSLSPEELEKKHQAILCHKSQTNSSAFYLLSFARKEELFGDYPQVELSGQASLPDKPVSFFGLSRLLPVSRETAQGEDDLTQEQGQIGYAVTDNLLLVRLEKPENLNRRLIFMLYLFGYNHKVPFGEMPKIRIVAKGTNLKVFDKKRLIQDKDISITMSPNLMVLRVPLRLLGEPDFVLSSLKVFGKALGAGESGFRYIEIK